ncbi:MAG: hypothetical protein HPY83_02305 [Anaerolineae bacterium]|nr:hypothetical protein [Anaerolineae bacterium]
MLVLSVLSRMAHGRHQGTPVSFLPFRSISVNQRSISVISVLFLLLLAVVPVRAQEPCPYADIRNESQPPLDREAVCAAARPLAEQDYRVLVLLTDYRPSGQDDWYDYVDAVEVEAGLRDPSQPDAFASNGIALEASTATDLSFAYSLTIGQALFGSALDTDAAAARVREAMRGGIAAGDPTAGFVEALGAVNRTLNPPPSPILRALVVAVGVLFLVAVGAVAYVLAVVPAQRRARLRAHLGRLRARVSNLLLAGEGLLQGATPEDTMLYALFRGYGGERYPELRRQVHDWLRQSQAALNSAFELRQQLSDPAATDTSLEDQVRAWETLYLTLVGSSERVLSLTEEQLRTLLDPMLVLERREEQDSALVEQLEAVRRQLAGLPLKVELVLVDPATVDADGILGYVDRVKAEIARLRQAQDEAPGRLDEARSRRRQGEEDLPSGFFLSPAQAFAGVDRRLQAAQAALDQGLYLNALSEADAALQGVAAVEALVKALEEHRRRLEQAQEVVNRGYRLPTLEARLQEVTHLRDEVGVHLTEGRFDQAQAGIESLSRASADMLGEAQEWEALRGANEEALARLRAEAARVSEYLRREARPAWEALRAYPEPSWSPMSPVMDQAESGLARAQRDLEQVPALNDMARQEFDRARELLQATAAVLEQVEGDARQVVETLERVRRAERDTAETLERASRELSAAAGLWRSEPAAVAPEVGVRLTEAERRLAEGRNLAQAGSFLAAVSALSAALDMASQARIRADRDISEVVGLRRELERAAQDARRRVEEAARAARNVPGGPLAATAGAQANRLRDALTQAERARLAATQARDREALLRAHREAVSRFRELESLAERTQRDIEEVLWRERQRHVMFPPLSGGPRPRGPSWPGPSGRSSPSHPGSSGPSSRPGSGGSRRPGGFGGSGRPGGMGGSSRPGGMGPSRRR